MGQGYVINKFRGQLSIPTTADYIPTNPLLLRVIQN